MGDRAWAGTAGVAAAAAFLPAAAGGFVYDDHRFYEGNPHLSRLSILWRAFADPVCQTADGTEAGLWRPLRTLSFALDKALFGASATGPHVVNALLHGAGTACVFALLRRFGVNAPAAFLGAMIYAVHPAQVESVAWISSRGDLLAALLVWGAILLELAGRTKSALVAGAFALLAKEQAVVWPVLAWIAMRLAGVDARAAFKRALAPAALVVLFLVARFAVLAEPTQQGGLGFGPARGPQMAAMLGHQTMFAVLPAGSLFDWQMPPASCPWPAALVAGAVIAAAFWRPTRLPTWWFLAALVPTLFLQAFVPLNILVADRFLLFALPALAFAAARAAETVGLAPAVVGALCFGALTERAIPTWRSDESLWGATVAGVPDHPRANHWLGLDALHKGDLQGAVARLRVAARGDARSAKTRFHLGSALEALGRETKDPTLLAEAYEEYGSAVAVVGDPRAEGRAEIVALATVAAVDVALVVGDDKIGAEKARALLASPRPTVPEIVREAWTKRVESLARSAEIHPLLGPEFATRVREWGRLP